MSSTKGEFDHDALHSPKMLADYLRALADGLEARSVTLTDENGVLLLTPSGLIRLRLRAQQKSDRVRLGVTLSWSRDASSEDDAASLRISSKP